MEGEISNFIRIWGAVLVSLCYCYAIGKIVPKGTKRLLTALPIVCLFLYLPLNLSSPHLSGVTGFFVAWLANFKLLLFAFGEGPLCSDPSISLPLFLAVACLPIKIQQSPYPKSHLNGQNKEYPSAKSQQNGQNKEYPSPKSSLNGPNEDYPSSKASQNAQKNRSPSTRKSKEGPLNYAIKGVLLALLVKLYDYSDYIHPKIILLLYSLHIYFLLELILAIGAALAQSLLGLELEPQFNEPYLSTSLQDFWGKRWNLMVTSILRPTVYEPTLHISSLSIGRKWAPLPAVFSTFVVSAVMHELMFYYLGRLSPSGDVTRFFVIHGFCTTLEIALKKALTGKWQLPSLVSGPLTVGFVLVTGFWLFIPQFTRCQVDVRAFEEYAAIGAVAKDISRKVLLLLRS